MLEFAANLSMLFTEVPFLDRFEQAALHGFRGVEFLFPYAFEPKDLRARLDKFDLQQILFNFPPGDWDGGERGIAIYPERRAEFKDGVAKAVDYADKLGCKKLHCLAGILPADSSRLDAVWRKTYIDNLKLATDAAAAIDATVLIEPINTQDIPRYFLNGTAMALDIIDEVGADNLRLQFDCYHMQIMEGRLSETIRAHLKLIHHIQIADAPGRHEPGSGAIDYDHVLRDIDSCGYAGWIGCEYNPSGTTADSLNWLSKLGRVETMPPAK